MSAWIRFVILTVSGAFVVAPPSRAVTPESDDEIRHNLEMRLQGSTELGELPIRVSVDGRVARLEGRVRLLFQSWRAEDVVSEARGLVDVENRLTVDSGTRSPAEITATIRRRFEDRLALASSSVEVQVADGKVVLSGSVKDARLRFDARDAAAATPGVVAVEDRIESPPATDEDLLKAAKQLLGPGSLKGVRGDFRPSVKDGVVTLEGSVMVLANRRAAEKIVLGINGVRSVENRVKVLVKRPPGDRG